MSMSVKLTYSLLNLILEILSQNCCSLVPLCPMFLFLDISGNKHDLLITLGNSECEEGKGRFDFER